MKRSWLALSVFPALLILPQAKLLRPYVHKGDQWTTATELDLNLDLRAAAGEKKEAEEFDFRYQRRERFGVEVLEAKEDLTAKARREYSRSSSKVRTRAGKGEFVEKQEDSPFHQDNQVLQKEGDAVKLVSGGAKLSAEMKTGLEIELPSSVFLPTTKVEEGQDWKIEGKKLANYLRQQIEGSGLEISEIDGSIQASFKGIEEEKGKKVAKISFEGTLSCKVTLPVEGKSEPARLPLNMNWKGALHFDPITSKPSYFLVEGTVESRESKDAAQNPWTAKGDFRWSLEMEERVAVSGEGIKLEPRFHSGDQITRSEKSVFEFGLDDIQVKVNGKAMELGQLPEQKFKFESNQKTTDELLDASEGQIKKLRREFQEVNFEAEGPTGDVPNPMEELEGKVVILEKEGKEVSAKLEGGGKIEEKLLKKMSMGDEFRNLLPEEAIKVGQAWTPDEKKLIEMFKNALPSPGDEEEESPMDMEALFKKISLSVDCKLLSAAVEEGVSTARISVKAKFDLDLTQDDLPKQAQEQMGGMEMEMSVRGSLEGEFIFDFKGGKPLKLDLAGPLQFEMNSSRSDEMEFEQRVKMSGTIEMHEDYSKTKAAK